MQHRKPKVPHVARKLRALRVRAGISPAQLAVAVGVDPSFIAHIEAGRKALGPGLAARAALVLGVDPELLTA